MVYHRAWARESHWLFIVSRQILIHYAWLFICPVRFPNRITHNTYYSQDKFTGQDTHTHWVWLIQIIISDLNTNIHTEIIIILCDFLCALCTTFIIKNMTARLSHTTVICYIHTCIRFAFGMGRVKFDENVRLCNLIPRNSMPPANKYDGMSAPNWTTHCVFIYT